MATSIQVRHVRTDINYRIDWLNIIIYSYNDKRNRYNSVSLQGACLWKIDQLEKVIKSYIDRGMI